MSAPPDLILALQREILDLRKRLDSLETASGLFVADAELDTRRGQVTVRFDPRNWRGSSMKNRAARDCPPDGLDAYAEALQWMADNPKPDADPKWAKANRADAARARSWARRLRAQASRHDIGTSSTSDAGAPSDFEAPTFEAPSFDAPSFEQEESDPWA